MATRGSGPPARWTPDGYDRIRSGLINAGHPDLVADLAAEYAILTHGDGEPTRETWILASQTARLCAAATRPAFERWIANVSDANDAYDALCHVLATWDGDLGEDAAEAVAREAWKVLAS